MYPIATPGLAWVYLVGHKDGRIKVGRTSNPRSRLDCHRASLPGVEWCHLFPAGTHYFSVIAEKGCIEAFAAIGARFKQTETFSGIDKAAAISTARVVVSDCRAAAAEQMRLEATRQREKEAWRAFKAQYVPTSVA